MDVDVFQNVDRFVWSADFIARHSSNREDIREVALQGLDLRSCSEILDIACAFGFCVPCLKDKVRAEARITGIELCSDYKQLFLKAADRAGLHGEFLAADVSALDRLPPGTFDLVLCSFALYFFPKVIPAIARVLKPDGFFIALAHAEGHLDEITRQVKEYLNSRSVLCGGGNQPCLEQMIQSFSDTNGHSLLSPWFKKVNMTLFKNSLLIRAEDFVELKKYIRFKHSFFVPKTTVPWEEVIEQVEKLLWKRIQVETELQISKDDAIFVCTAPNPA